MVYLVGIPHELETGLKLGQVPVGDHILLCVGHPHTNLGLRGLRRGEKGWRARDKEEWKQDTITVL